MAKSSYTSRLAEVDELLLRGHALTSLEGASQSLGWQVSKVLTTLQNHFIGLRVSEWPDGDDDFTRADRAIAEARASLAYAERLVAEHGPGSKIDSL